MKIAAAYIRVSTSDQLEYSPDSQLRLIRDYAQRNNMIVQNENIFQDDGISGRSAEKRHAFQKMILCAKQKKFDIILIYSTSRFARNLEDSIVYKSMLQRECGIEVISITQPFVDKKTDMLTSAIYGVMDEWYSMDLADNVKRGMTQKALTGGFQTAPSLGYFVGTNGLEIDEEEAKIIKLIFEQYLYKGLGCFQIAKSLNQAGVKTKKGNPIENRTVEYILQNPIYKGYTRWTPSGKAKTNSPTDTIVIKSTHTPIISEEMFESVQKKFLKERRIKKPNSRPLSECRHWLSGLVKCGNCGKTLSFIQTHPVNFQCGGYSKGTCQVSHSISARKLENSVFSLFDDILHGTNKVYLKNVAAIDNNDDEIIILSLEKNKIEKKLSRAKDAYLMGTDSIEEYTEYKKTFQTEIIDITNKIEQLRSEKIPAEPFAFSEKLNSVVDLLRNSCGMEAKQRAIRSIVDKIVFNKTSKAITVYFFWN